MRRLAALVLASAVLSLPAPAQTARLVQIAPGLHSVEGELAGFDPAHPSVVFDVPAAASPPPLIVFVHGGGGGRDNAGAMRAFRSRGVAVLGFDAFATNGFDRPWEFWLREMTYEARQRMIYRVAHGAIAWARRQPGIDGARVFAYGLSNGADVVANLAAAYGPEDLRGAFAEGIAGAGIGLPDRVRAPLHAIFGRLDDFGSAPPGTLRWVRRVPCAFNAPRFDGPPGNAAGCNAQTGRGGQTEAPIDWIERQRAMGAPVRVHFYEDAAHGIFGPPLRLGTARWGSGVVASASVGATPEARARALEDVLAIVLAP